MREEKRDNQILHILKAIASGLIWGLGQLFNKQYVKALMFFLVFVLMIGIEVSSGDYLNNEPFDLYETKIPGDYLGGEDIRDNSSESFSKKFPLALKFYDSQFSDPEWETFLVDNPNLTSDLIIEFTGKRIRDIHEANIDDINDQADILANQQAIIYVEQRTTENLRTELQNPLATKETNPVEWQAIYDRLYPSLYPARYQSRFNVNYKELYSSKMLEDDFLSGMQNYFTEVTNMPGSPFLFVGPDDWNELLLRIYFTAFPEEFNKVNEEYDNYFYEQ